MGGSRKQHVALVLGAAVLPDGKPSAALKRRALHAAGLWLRGDVSKLVLSGGGTMGMPSEAHLMAEVIQDQGVPAAALVREEYAQTTAENFSYCLPLLQADELSDLVVVTDRFHVPRVKLVACRLGIRIRCDCPPEGPTGFLSRAKAAARELIAIGWYLVKPFGGR